MRFVFVWILFTQLLIDPSWAATSCKKVFSEKAGLRGELLEQPVVRALQDFANKHKLPYRVETFGPKEHQQQRFLVAVDPANKTVMRDYMESFHLDKPLGKMPGALVLEFTSETPKISGHYINGALRTSPRSEDPIYRYTEKRGSHEGWWQSEFLPSTKPVRETGVLGFSHIIGLTEAQLANVKVFLDPAKSAERGPCKSPNCVSWIPNIELGKTSKDSTTKERNHLFNYLGVSRTMAHFEINRRLIHAANSKHAGMVVFVSSEKGMEVFRGNKLLEAFPPVPKVPYSSIIAGAGPKPEALEAVKIISDNDKVFFPIAAGASAEAMQALAVHTKNLQKGVDVHVLVNGVSERVFADAITTQGKKFRIHALFLGGNLRKLYSEGRVNYIPGNLGDFTRLLKDPNLDTFNYNAIVVRVSPADAQGRHSLGPNNDMIKTIIRNRPEIKIIAEVNENIPFTVGENYLNRSQIHSFFKSKTELAGPPVLPLSEVEINIGQYLGSLIPSHATIQVGIGNIFGGLPRGLKENNVSNLDIVTEMFGDPLKDVVALGIAQSARTGFVYGSGDLYRWIHKNPKIKILETEEVNDVARIIKTPQFHAINTALQVSLLGEVNATMGPNGRISSPGGQVEFMSGAARSEGGKAIIAIRSTAKMGSVSTIVLDLYKGPITTPHESVTHVVTEFGIADLRGKSESERAVALINIAHPKFKSGLKKEALERKIITREQAYGSGVE